MALLGPLGAKIGAGVSLALLIALGIMWALLAGANRHSAKLQTALNEQVALFDMFKASVAANTALARAQDAENKARVEGNQNTVSRESEDEIRRRIAAAVAAVRLRAGTPTSHPGSRGEAAVPGSATAAAGADGAGGATLVSADDLAICATNTEKAAGWPSWWRSVEAVPR